MKECAVEWPFFRFTTQNLPRYGSSVLRPVEGVRIGSTDDLVGLRLADRYSVDEIIGRGGMSVVFRGTDKNLRRPVAIKVFSDVFSGRAKKLTYRHFVQEAFALSRLNHPSTIRIFDFGVIDHPDIEAPFQISELMTGGTLRDFVKRKGTQSPEDAVYVLEGICGALSEAHSHQIIHRDVKPTNILFGRAGKQRIVKLSDFSVAQSACEAAGRTLGDDTLVTQASFYSIGWSAPEQIRGERVDVTADVYGLGLVLAYLVTGQRIQQQREVTDFYLEAPRLDESLEQGLARTGLTGALAEVILTACRARPEQRHQSVPAFLDAMQRAVRNQSTPWMEASPPPPAPEPAKNSTLLVLEDITKPDVVLAGRRLRLYEVAHTFNHEIEDRMIPMVPRVRLTFLPSSEHTRVHLRGLNCFLRKPSGAVTAGVEFSEDGHLELLSSDRTSVAGANVRLGQRSDTHWLLTLGEQRIAVPIDRASAVACIELVPEGEAHLFFRP